MVIDSALRMRKKPSQRQVHLQNQAQTAFSGKFNVYFLHAIKYIFFVTLLTKENISTLI